MKFHDIAFTACVVLLILALCVGLMVEFVKVVTRDPAQGATPKSLYKFDKEKDRRALYP